MKDIDNLCLNCWSELTEGAVCAECGYDNDTANETMYLPAKTVLEGKYVIGSVKEHESDAVTYMAYDGTLDKAVLIREFFPKGITNRLEGNTCVHIRQKYINDFEKLKKSFFKLWTTMEKLHSLSAVVPVYDVFEANDTVYAVIENMDCISLREYLLRNEEGYILWDDARLMFMPVLTTLESLHTNGIVHGSITPDKLVLCRDGRVRLTPFPIQEASDFSSVLEFNVSDGYTALEQYENSHKMCPATDVYSFTACIYRALVGTNPPSATAREANDKLMIPNSIAEAIPIHVIKAMVNGLQIYPEKRIKSTNDLRELLDAAPAVQAKSAQPQEDVYQEGATGGYPDYDQFTRGPKKKSKAAIIALIIMIVIAIGAGIYVVKFTDLVNKPEDTETTQPIAKTYQVPNFINNGYTRSDIENNGAWNEQFKFTFEGDYSADTEEGNIFKQSVEAGETVDEGTEIILTVSKGIQTETVPDVGSLTLEEATKRLVDLGFKVSSVEVYNDGSHTQGTVKSAYGIAPAADSVVAVGEEIILQVYGEAITTTQPATTEPEDDDYNSVSVEMNE